MASENLSNQIHGQHSVFVKEESFEESDIPVFCYESATKQEVILEDELPEDGQPGDDCSNELPVLDKDRYKHYKCPECNKRFKKLARANSCQKKHERIRLGLFECKLCQKRFANKHHLASHEKAHQKGSTKMFKCNCCRKRFSSKELLENHEENQKKGIKETVVCEICLKAVGTRHYLKQHEAKHLKHQNVSKTLISNLELEGEDLAEPEQEDDSKQFYIIEEIPESTVVKEEPVIMEAGAELTQSQPIKAEPDFGQLIPQTVVFGELPVDRKLEVKEELIIPS